MPKSFEVKALSERILTWNLQRKSSRAEAIVDAIRRHDPKILCLQEVNGSLLRCLRDAFAEFEFVLENSSESELFSVVGVPNDTLELHSHGGPLHLSERLVLASSRGMFVCSSHVPPATNGPEHKTAHFERLRLIMAEHQDHPFLLAGDFNSPQIDHPDLGRIVWGERLKKDLTKKDVASRKNKEDFGPGVQSGVERAFWDDCSTGNMRLLGEQFDAYRYGFTHISNGIPRKYDHIIASTSIEVLGYHHDLSVLQKGISDHAIVVAEISWPGLNHS